MPSMLTNNRSRGFTLIEVLVIAPIVILAVGTFVAVMVNMTGEVLQTRDENAMVFSTQDSLNTIEDDIKLSGAFLAGNELAAPSPQGYAGGAGVANSSTDPNSFTNVGTNGNMLILRGLTTTKNPLDPTRLPVYIDQPNSCTQKTSNKLFTDNVIYFVKAGTLWRRTIIQQGNGTPGTCGDIPWQQPSCAVGSVNSSTCKVNDIRLLDNVQTFTITYLANAADTDTNATNTTATNSTNSIDARNQALATATAAKISLTSSKTVSGKAISHTAYIQANKLNIAPDTPVVVPLAVNQQPTNQTVLWTAKNTSFTTSSTYAGTTVQWQQSTNGGATWSDIAGATSWTYTLPTVSMTMNGYQYRAVTTNGATVVYSNAAVLTVYIWTGVGLQNSWTDYGSPYSPNGYTITPSGFVMLRGLLKRSGTITSGEVVGTLPVGYRPAYRLIFQTSTSNAGHFARVDVDTTGSILVIAGDPGYLSLEGINFMPSGTTFNPLTLVNGWTYYGSPWAVPGYATDTVGRTHVQGLVGGGNVADNVQIVNNLPASARTGEYLHVPDYTSGPGPGYVGIDPTNGVVAKGAGNGNGWMNINAMFYPGSFSASWTNLGLMSGWTTLSGFSTPQYIKGSDNVVMVKGLIQGGTIADGTVVGCLPAGYRPKDRTLIQGGITNAKAVRWDIRQTDGCIEIYYGDSAWASLDAISFVAEQ